MSGILPVMGSRTPRFYDLQVERQKRRRRSRAYRRIAVKLAIVVSLGVGLLLAYSPSQDTSTIKHIGDALQKLKPNVPSLWASEATITGRASVIDGDTIEIHGERIRFNGIDAPESDQHCEDEKGQSYACGRRAADALDQFLTHSVPTRCHFVVRDRYNRFVGDCYRADGMSVADQLVRTGWAMDWPRYSNGAYAEQQRAAKAEKLGLWAGTFQPPWEWRAEWHAEEPAKIVPRVRANPGKICNIKGNISISSGERIYHVPGQKYYPVTRISPSKGERWFCSEAEARAAGWRKSKL